eukprot:2213398-Pleurochrysis_carterae.AAC.2
MGASEMRRAGAAEACQNLAHLPPHTRLCRAQTCRRPNATHATILMATSGSEAPSEASLDVRSLRGSTSGDVKPDACSGIEG